MGKAVLNDEVRKKLASIAPFSTIAIDFTPEIYNDVEEQYRPVFHVKPLIKSLVHKISKMSVNAEQLQSGNASNDIINENLDIILDVTRECVVGWRNFYDTESGEEIEFQADGSGSADSSIWQYVSYNLATQIFAHIMRRSGLTQEEKQGL